MHDEDEPADLHLRCGECDSIVIPVGDVPAQKLVALASPCLTCGSTTMPVSDPPS